MIGIVGYGWLGKAIVDEFFAKKLPITVGIRSLKNESVLKSKTIPFFHTDENKIPLEIALQLTHLIICIPPPQSENPNQYGKVLHELVAFIPNTCKVLFTSSTSVYPDLALEMDEDYKFDEDWIITNRICIAENTLLNKFEKQLTILRLGGLVGKNRNLAKYISGKILSYPTSVINLIEQKDVVNAIFYWYDYGFSSFIYNLVCPTQTKRADYYLTSCKDQNLPLPIIDLNDLTVSKSIIGTKISSENKFRYVYLSALDFTN
jgi:nucleoside-diphosphate-sugar epimerase